MTQYAASANVVVDPAAHLVGDLLTGDHGGRGRDNLVDIGVDLLGSDVLDAHVLDGEHAGHRPGHRLDPVQMSGGTGRSALASGSTAWLDTSFTPRRLPRQPNHDRAGSSKPANSANLGVVWGPSPRLAAFIKRLASHPVSRCRCDQLQERHLNGGAAPMHRSLAATGCFPTVLRLSVLVAGVWATTATPTVAAVPDVHDQHPADEEDPHPSYRSRTPTSPRLPGSGSVDRLTALC